MKCFLNTRDFIGGREPESAGDTQMNCTGIAWLFQTTMPRRSHGARFKRKNCGLKLENYILIFIGDGLSE
jgi:hypothetical protein